ncbi:Zinc finger protein 28 [Camponotus floridanus]|uniref:Zinc finger protein 28 n=1 Tax=Camponotus floridanus TaxID=104421 RepID=E2AEU8_CAMFO|nr:Zinc finger protein 28 [Camponotus floridanus]
MEYGDKSTFICLKCGKNYARKASLQRHLQSTLCGTLSMFYCKFCKYRTNRKDVLVRHMRYIHHPKRTANWNVRDDANNYDSTTYHMHKRYVCPFCKKVYAPKSLLKKHIQMGCKMNPRNTQFACTFCPYKSMYKANMERHVRNVHNTALLWPNKIYISDALYQGSTSDETREKIHVCADCGKGYVAKRSLWRHRKFECVNARPKFSCEKCPYKSPHKWRMDTHRKTIHALLWPYKRVYEYNTGEALQQQQGSAIEAHERTYICADCGKSYAVKRSLWRHRKFECVNAKPRINCGICPYKSPHKWCIDRHKKKHHNVL